MQYRGYTDEGENKVNVARSSLIYEHMLRWFIDRISDINFWGKYRYISDVIIPRELKWVDELTEEFRNMLL